MPRTAHPRKHYTCWPFVLMELKEFRQQLRGAINDFEVWLDQTRELSRALDDTWLERVRRTAGGWRPGLEIDDAAYQFYRLLDSGFVNGDSLEMCLRCLAGEASRQQRPTAYRKTRRELSSQQLSQVHGSLFEITTLASLIDCGDPIRLYANVPNTSSDVEASISPDGREIYVECKAIGYSRFEPKAPGFWFPDPGSMRRQLSEAVASKLLGDHQLAAAQSHHPTVLLLALGTYATWEQACEVIPDDLAETGTSAIGLFGSVFCRRDFRLFTNPAATHHLSSGEVDFFRTRFAKTVLGRIAATL